MTMTHLNNSTDSLFYFLRRSTLKTFWQQTFVHFIVVYTSREKRKALKPSKFLLHENEMQVLRHKI